MARPDGFPTADDIAKMILDQTEESASLDFKKTLDLSKKVGEKGSNATKQDIVRDVAAFANGVGGTIIIGVSDEGNPDHATGWGHITPEEASRIEEVVEDSCSQSIDPKVVGLSVRREKVAETALAIVAIPKSRELHAVQLDGVVEYWIRPDKKKRRMTPLEIRDAILASHVGVQAAAAAPPGYGVIAGALDEAMEASGTHPMFFMAISPSDPQPDIWSSRSGEFRRLFTQGAGQDRSETFATDIAPCARADSEGVAFRNEHTDFHVRDDGVVTWRLALSVDQMLTMCPDGKTLALLPSALEGYPLSLLRLYHRIAGNNRRLDLRLVQLCFANIQTVRLFRQGGHRFPQSGKAMLDTEGGISFYGKPKLVVPKTAPLAFSGSSSPDRVAFKLVSAVYSAFGHEEDAIPDWNPEEENFIFQQYE